jgi:hypothetical protein
MNMILRTKVKASAIGATKIPDLQFLRSAGSSHERKMHETRRSILRKLMQRAKNEGNPFAILDEACALSKAR